MLMIFSLADIISLLSFSFSLFSPDATLLLILLMPLFSYFLSLITPLMPPFHAMLCHAIIVSIIFADAAIFAFDISILFRH
jgi:hypothetical protein